MVADQANDFTVTVKWAVQIFFPRLQKLLALASCLTTILARFEHWLNLMVSHAEMYE